MASSFRRSPTDLEIVYANMPCSRLRIEDGFLPSVKKTDYHFFKRYDGYWQCNDRRSWRGTGGRHQYFAGIGTTLKEAFESCNDMRALYYHGLQQKPPAVHLVYCCVNGRRQRNLNLARFIIPQQRSVTTVIDIANDGRVDAFTCALSDKHHRPVRQESYPNLDTPIATLVERFQQSSSRLLLLIGPPGTGKTNLIREIVRLMNVEIYACMDRELLQKRRLYVEFMSNTKQLMVIEDADDVVMKRKDGNSSMSLILNILDGLMISDKRMIISTNLESTTSIDEALMRPGRCFDVITFRTLTSTEASVARSAMGLPPVAFNESERYTLSEVINFDEVQAVKKHRNQRIGF